MKRKAEKNEGEREAGEKEKKKKERKMSIDIGLVCGSYKQLKNIEWWQVSDGAKRDGVF